MPIGSSSLSTVRAVSALRFSALRLSTLLSRLPGQCEVCRAAVAGTADGALCNDCLARFARLRPRCERCGMAAGVAVAACGACLSDPPPFERTVCAVDYGFPWDALIAGFKFEGRVELAGALAQLLATAVCAQCVEAGLTLPQVIVAVPLANERLAERGYNQSWELARRLAERLRLPAHADLLQRPVQTPHQADLDRAARRLNLRGAFMVDPQRRALLNGRSVALVDDVMTTGATAREATATLLRAGAASVQVWALARTA